MPTYIGLYKLTDQGRKDIKNSPGRIEEAIKAWEKVGGTLVGFYATMGEYDYIGISEAPNDEVAMTFALGICSLGNVQVTTLKAFSTIEFAGMIKNLP